MSEFPFVFTTAGRAAIAAANGLGMALEISHLALGDATYAITDENGPLDAVRSMVNLQNELMRVPFSAGAAIGVDQVKLLAVVAAATGINGDDPFWIGELGIIANDGTLVAVLSDAAGPIGYRGNKSDWLFDYILAWTDLPDSALNVVYQGDAAVVGLAADLAALEADYKNHNHDDDYALKAHTHEVSDITNLQSALSTPQNIAMTAFVKANILSTDPAGKQGAVIGNDFKTDTLAVKTGATYEADFYTNGAIGSADISSPGQMIHSGFGEYQSETPDAAFDDNLSTGTATLNYASGAIGAWLGQTFPTAKDIRKIRFYRDNALSDTTAWLVKYSDDGVTWTTAASVSGLSATGWHEIIVPDVGAHTHWIMVVNASRQDGTNYPVHIAEIEMYEFVGQDMVLVSDTLQLDASDPTDISIYFLVTDVDLVIDGVDRVVSVSIDGGSTFAPAAFMTSWTYEAGKKLVRFDADLSAQTGNQLVWKLETFNLKLQKIEHFSAVPLLF